MDRAGTLMRHRTNTDKLVDLVIRAILETIILLMQPVVILLSPLTSYAGRVLARRDQADFEQAIRDEMPFLFLDLGARVVPNEGVDFPPSFDGAFITLEVGEMLIQFGRGRGDLNVRIAQLKTPTNWMDLEVLLGAIQDIDDIRRCSINSLTKAAFELRSHWDAIGSLLHPAQKANLDVALKDFARKEQIYLAALSKELNRTIYGE